MSFSFGDPSGGDEVLSVDGMKEHLRGLADEIVSGLNEKDPAHSQELLSVFVSELFLSATKQSIRAERRKKQDEGIARAKARGVHFGPKRGPLPENFDEVRVSWRNREMNLKQAAKLCGMPATTFYDAVRRAEQEESAG